jgi:Mg-chelatase subunit ChlD
VTATFDGGVAPAVALTLVAKDGTETLFEMDPADPAKLIAAAGPGRWRIRVTQPVASVAVTWDTSGSVGALMPAIERMIRRLSWELEAEREAINLLPFRGETSEFLMPEWSGDRATVLGALLAYPFSDSSSEAESAMLVAARQLSTRAGQRAIVLVTDASFTDTSGNEQLWRYLAQGQVKVFSLYLPVDYDPARTRAQVNLMSDWANAAGGHLSRFASQADSETAYRRVAAWLNRPAGYAFAVSADTSPPPPGLLRVELGAGEDSAPGAGGAPLAVSVVLDASGSMLQRMGGERRIDIAKKVLRELGENVLPEGLPVSLRVFGHDAPGSCESELFLPLMPLERGTFAAAVDRVQSVNLARTSIAASLRATPGDLAAAEGSKIVVLITDGEETCGGDPLAEIGRLRQDGVDARLNIVGFAIDDPALRETFEAWASAGAGAYFDASDFEALGSAVRDATALSYTVLDEAAVEVGHGIVGEALELPPGRYTIRFGGQIDDVEVTLAPGETETLVVSPS